MDIKLVEEFAKTKFDSFLEEHVRSVVKCALELCEYYPEADKKVVEIAAWLHDVVHAPEYTGDQHAVESAKVAKEFLQSMDLGEEKIKKIIHCIEAHRTSTEPWPETIEAKIVFSADNMSHFDLYQRLVDVKGKEWTLEKLHRDLKAEHMLPEAVDYAKGRLKEIEAEFMKPEKRPNTSLEMVILKDGRVLLGKLTKSWCGELYPLWCLPGSDIRFGETFEAAIKRQLKSLLEMELVSYRALCVNANYEFDGHYVVTSFEVEAKGEPQVGRPDEIERWEWVGTDKLPKLFEPSRLTMECFLEGKISVSE